MSRRVLLPTELQIAETLAALRREQPAKPPTVVAVADRLGLTNATFWRHFPDLCQEIADARRRAVGTQPVPNRSPDDVDQRTILARLRDNNSRLERELEVAAAEVQRLTLENRALIAHAQQASKVIPISPHV